MNSVKPVVYSEVRGSIPQGALLQYRAGWRPSNRLISLVGCTPYVHSGMAAWWGDVVMLLETLQFRGGRAVRLSTQVKQYPGQWDVFEVRKPFRSEAAVQTMLRITGTPYGWGSLAKVALTHTPVLRWVFRPATDDKLNNSAPFCSQAVSRACRAGGRDPRPNRADVATEPGHLVHPGFSEYKYTLFATAEQVANLT